MSVFLGQHSQKKHILWSTLKSIFRNLNWPDYNQGRDLYHLFYVLKFVCEIIVWKCWFWHLYWIIMLCTNTACPNHLSRRMGLSMDRFFESYFSQQRIVGLGGRLIRSKIFFISVGKMRRRSRSVDVFLVKPLQKLKWKGHSAFW